MIVVALAVGLVAARDVLSTSRASSNAATAGPGGTPRYYTALTPVAGSAAKDNLRDGVVVGDSLTGTRIAVFQPPADTSFQSVTAAADDKTFVVYALTSSTDQFDYTSTGGAVLTGSWYKVSLSPGTAHPATLTRLPVKSWSWAGERVVQGFFIPSPGEVFASAVSESGRELAVADIPLSAPGDSTAAKNWQEVKVYSLASGRLLYDWAETNPEAAFAHGLGSLPSLTWIVGDHALLYSTAHEGTTGAVSATLRRLDLAGPARGNLGTHATHVWSGVLTWNSGYGCYAVNYWPPLISADGKTVSCINFEEPSGGQSQFNFDTDPIPGTGAAIKSVFDYRVTSLKNVVNVGSANVYWVSASGGTLIGEWNFVGGHRPSLTTPHFGAISHGKFTPFKVPANLLNATAIAW